MRRSTAVLAVAALALTAACEPDSSPTDPSRDLQVQTATDPEGQINQLKAQLLPGPEIGAASQSFAAVKSALDQGDLASAREAMFDMVDQALDLLAAGQLQDPRGPLTTTEALIDYVQVLYQFVGLDAPSESDLQAAFSGQQDAVAGVLGPEGGTLTTPDEFAGVEFPEGAVDGDILVIIERQDVPTASACLPTPLPQAEGCYRYDTEPDIGDVNDQDSFNEDVIAGVCIDPALTDDDNYLLHKFDPERPAEGVIPLDSEPAGFLSCGGFQAARAPTWWGRLAQDARTSLDRHVVSWLTPAPLRATDRGLGGSVGAFSRIGWARAGNLTALSGDGQSGPTSSVLSDPIEVEVSNAHGSAGVIEDVEVEFEVIGGGGDLTKDGQTFAAAAEDTTNNDGIATVDWRLGSATGTQTLVARLPGADPDSLIFTATATEEVITNVLPTSTSTEFVFRGDSTAPERIISYDVADFGSGLALTRADYVSNGSVVDSLSVPNPGVPGTKAVDPNNVRDGDPDPSDVADGPKTLRILAIDTNDDSVSVERAYTLDTTAPTIDPGSVPPASLTTSNTAETFTLTGSVTDANDLTEATVQVLEETGEDCDLNDPPVAEGSGDGEVDDQSQSVLASAANFDVDFTIQNPNEDVTITYCFFVTGTDEALDNTGAPDGNTAVLETETTIDWQVPAP